MSCFRALLLGLCVTLGFSACTPNRAPARPATQAHPSQVPTDVHQWRLNIPKAAPHAKLTLPTPARFTLANGYHVYSLQRPTTTVSLTLTLRHDAQTLRNTKPGLAALTARMLTEGTREHPELELAEAIENLGTDFSVNTGRDGTTISLEVLPPDLEAALALLAEVTTRPAFSKQAFERVRMQWLDNIRDSFQDPRSLASVLGYQALLGKELGAPALGYPEDVAHYTLRDLQLFHASVYLPYNASLAIAGPFESVQLQDLVQKYFAPWQALKKKPTQPTFTLPAPLGTQILIFDRPGSPQSALFVAQTLPAHATPGYAQRELLITAFGGLFTSRLNQNLREKKAYTYGAFGNYVATRNWGALAISTSVETKFTAAALREIELELSDLGSQNTKRPLLADEVDRARADIVHSLVAHLSHTTRIASDLVQLFVHDLPLDYYVQLAREIEATPLKALQREAEALIRPKALTIAIVGDRATIEAPLRKLGYPITIAPKIPGAP